MTIVAETRLISRGFQQFYVPCSRHRGMLGGEPFQVSTRFLTDRVPLAERTTPLAKHLEIYAQPPQDSGRVGTPSHHR
jgi:hypothetical protein